MKAKQIKTAEDNKMFLTQLQIKKASEQYPYLILRLSNNDTMAINSKVIPLNKKKYGYKPNEKTNFIGYFPCNFQEYISNKVPFIV